MHHLASEDPRRVRRWLLDHHGHAGDLHALHDALDGARAEVIGVGLLVAYADVYLEALDCSSLIGRVLFDQQRVLTESDNIMEGTGCGRGF